MMLVVEGQRVVLYVHMSQPVHTGFCEAVGGQLLHAVEVCDVLLPESVTAKSVDHPRTHAAMEGSEN